jgi:predicted DNA-binding transcriptional regulator AlpA
MTKAYTINSFCEAYSISRSLFYKLKEQGKAPHTFTLGNRVLISIESAEKWQASMETPVSE